MAAFVCGNNVAIYYSINTYCLSHFIIMIIQCKVYLNCIAVLFHVYGIYKVYVDLQMYLIFENKHHFVWNIFCQLVHSTGAIITFYVI